MRSGDLPLVASSTLDLWSEIKDALCDGDERVIGRCSNAASSDGGAGEESDTRQKLSG